MIHPNHDYASIYTNILPALTGVERDMQVCHTQPHLVPPMKLVVYDDLPSPRIHHSRNSLSISSWIEEGAAAIEASRRLDAVLSFVGTRSAEGEVVLLLAERG